VYDFAEAVWDHLFVKHRNVHGALKFECELNEFFIENGIGWLLLRGQIVERSPEVLAAVQIEAVNAVRESGRNTAADELHKAHLDLSKRPDADPTGAVQHGLAALECLARDISGNSKATLGELARTRPDLFPKVIQTIVEKAWGFASDTGRHVREGGVPTLGEAQMMIGLVASVSAYLLDEERRRVKRE